MAFELSICTDKQYWNQFVKNSPQGNIFCSAVFMDALDVDYELCLVKKKEDVCLGAIIMKDETGQFVHSPVGFTMYQGVLLSQLYSDTEYHSHIPDALKIVDFLLTELEKKYERITFCLHHRFEDLRSFLWFHYHNSEYGQFKINLQYTGLIDLKDIPDLKTFLNAIRTTRRYEYNKAIKDGLKVEVSRDIDMLANLHRMTFERQGIKLSEKANQTLRNIAEAALSKGFGELLLCRDANGEAISATLFLFDNHYGYYMFGANHPVYRNAGAGTFLMLENVRRCQERGIQFIDVCGINSPNRGDFKTSFNAAPVPYFVVLWERHSHIANKII